MDVHYNGFVWDDKKAEKNFKKHDINFQTAVYVYSDPFHIEYFDEINSVPGEDRYNAIGLVKGVVILFVTSTDRNGERRIISARKATQKERRDYYENRKSFL